MSTGMFLGYELPEAGLPDPTRFLLDTARKAEAAGVHHLVLGDRPAAGPAGPRSPASLVAVSLLAVSTTRIGLVMTAAPAYHEPYNLARMVASVDHISHGRAGWRVVTGPDASADANHRREGMDPAADREARAREFVPVVRDLWDTWEDGAFVHEKGTGRFIDSGRVHVLDHRGTLRVRGPLNVVRPPQGHPVVLADATDPLSAAHADVLTAGNPDSAPTAAEAGGRPRLGVVTPFVAPTAEGARELHARAGAPSSDRDRAVLTGTPGEVAERLGAWFGRGAVDGFTVRFPAPGPHGAGAGAEGIGEFTAAVLPLLTAAGLFPATYAADTLRGHFGLSRPENRLAERIAAGPERD
ncbi:LLM class flavin-dependent oxidoreductase [Streptomyces sp. NPDC002990]